MVPMGWVPARKSLFAHGKCVEFISTKAHTKLLLDAAYLWVYAVSMAIKIIRVQQCTCERCGHEWRTRTDDTPTICPKCKSPYWNRPRQKKGKP